MGPSDPTSPSAGWLHELGVRFRTRWFAKMVVTVLCMTVFFVCYFWLLNHPRIPVTIVPRTWVDRLISFHSWPVFLYISLWVYVPLAPAFLVSPRELISYLWAAVAMSALGFAVFILWPTAVPKMDVDGTLYSSVSFLKTVDASGNAFPSLHVAFAVFSAIWFHRVILEVRAGALVAGLNWLWCAGIVYSTLAIRQHVALDALAGGALGASVAWAHLRFVSGFRTAPECKGAIPRA